MRTIVATAVCALVLTGSAIAVAQSADRSATNRARMIEALKVSSGDDCGCTAATRAKDRIASRITAIDNKN